MASAIFEISTDGGSTWGTPGEAQALSAAGGTFSCRVANISDVQSVQWLCFGAHDEAATLLVPTNLRGSPASRIADFVYPAGAGQSYGIECRINGGKTRNTDGTEKNTGWTARSAAYVPTAGGKILFFLRETYEISSNGVVDRLNELFGELTGGASDGVSDFYWIPGYAGTEPNCAADSDDALDLALAVSGRVRLHWFFASVDDYTPADVVHDFDHRVELVIHAPIGTQVIVGNATKFIDMPRISGDGVQFVAASAATHANVFDYTGGEAHADTAGPAFVLDADIIVESTSPRRLLALFPTPGVPAGTHVRMWMFKGVFQNNPTVALGTLGVAENFVLYHFGGSMTASALAKTDTGESWTWILANWNGASFGNDASNNVAAWTWPPTTESFGARTDRIGHTPATAGNFTEGTITRLSAAIDALASRFGNGRVQTTALTATVTTHTVGDYTLQRFTADGDYLIRSVTAPSPDRSVVHIFANADDTNTVELPNEDTTGTTAANRLVTDTGASVVLDPGEMAVLVRDPTTARWRVAKFGGGAGGGGEDLEATLALGNVVPSDEWIEFPDADTDLATAGNLRVGKEFVVMGANGFEDISLMDLGAIGASGDMGLDFGDSAIEQVRVLGSTVEITAGNTVEVSGVATAYLTAGIIAQLYALDDPDEVGVQASIAAGIKRLTGYTQEDGHDLIPRRYDGSVTSGGGTADRSEGLGSESFGLITAWVRVHGSDESEVFAKCIRCRCYRDGAGNTEIDAQETLWDSGTASWSFVASESGGSVRFRLTNSTGTTREYSIFSQVTSCDLPP